MGLTEKIAEEYTAVIQNTDKDSTSPISKKREEAYQHFTKLGIPSNRHEEWRYTHIKNKLPESLSLLRHPVSSSPAFHTFPSLQAHRVVLINGTFDAGLSSISEQKGLTISSLKEAFKTKKEIVDKYFGHLVQLNKEHFAALNTAFATDGVFIHIEENMEATLPIVIVNISDNNGETFTQSRNLIVLEQGASAYVVEDFQNSSAAAFMNHVSEIFLAPAASIHLTQLQTETLQTTAVYTTEIELLRDSSFTCTCVSLEGKLIRNNINARMRGENAEAHLYGLYYGTENSLIDNHLLIDHVMPNGQSTQLYKGILDDESTGVFNGKVFVQPDAQKTNAFQSSKVLLLSDNASINAKPQLEIFADDVKCSHGAAIGQLNNNELFYFLARGIEPKQARALLTYAFANNVLDKIKLDELRAYVEEKLRSRLNISF